MFYVFFKRIYWVQTCKCFSIDHHLLGTSQLLNYNEAVIELQIGPSSIDKQELDTPVTAMFYHFLAPEGRHPTLEENFIDKYQMQGPIFYGTLVN